MDVSKLGQNKPEKFTDTEEAWANWSWHYRNHLAAASLTAREAMKFAESSGHTPVDEDEVKRRGWHSVSDQLYSSLVGFTQDKSESPSLVRNTAEGQGLEAWRGGVWSSCVFAPASMTLKRSSGAVAGSAPIAVAVAVSAAAAAAMPPWVRTRPKRGVRPAARAP